MDFVAKAQTRGADAIILDLEDSVASANKSLARANLAEASELLARQGMAVLVRVNGDADLLDEDLNAAIGKHVHGLVVPKVESAQQLQRLSEKIDSLEKHKGLVCGASRILAFIESPIGLHRVHEIAASSTRLFALSLGTEDFTAAIGAVPNRETLYYPCQQIVFAAHSVGIQPLGFCGSIADFSDMDAFAGIIKASRDMGFRGGCCIHPNQVLILKKEFSPNDTEIADAKAIVDLFEQAIKDGKGAVSYKGKMVDVPVYKRAQALLASI